MILYNIDADTTLTGGNIWEKSARRAGMSPEVIAMCRRWDWAGKCDRERRSDMRTVEYELWVTGKIERNEKGEVVSHRGEERLGKGEVFTAQGADAHGVAIGELREEILQDHLDEFADHKPPLKLTDIEVRARPFP